MPFISRIRKWMNLPDPEVMRLREKAAEICALESRFREMTDSDLRSQAETMKARITDGAELDEVAAYAFAAVREAGRRTPLGGTDTGLFHHPVQLMAGWALHEGKVAEQETGEGKTLVATCPAFLNALLGRGVHIVTVNDYLARRDWEWMGPIYRALGLRVGCVQASSTDSERRRAYSADVTYAQAAQIGMDYLRDNTKRNLDHQVQRRHYAILDDVDDTLIDEARTPLVVSGPAPGRVERYARADSVARRLQHGRHFRIDDGEIVLTDTGIDAAQRMVGVESFYSPDGIDAAWAHYVILALRAHYFFERGRDYQVEAGKAEEIVLIDSRSQRLAPGRRYSDGLHQAIEQKEGVRVHPEQVPQATITIQNLFRSYEKLAGMTATAKTEEMEFRAVYGLEVISIPTHLPRIREDSQDLVYRTKAEKWAAVVDEIEEHRQKRRPVLVGVLEQDKSDLLSAALSRRGIEHSVLNARNHELEAEIIRRAGQKDSVTVVTKMAGRGTDIQLGQGVSKLGGLHVVGTERHESRRLDNQLRGRSGRQGDPGSSRFFLSLEDDLMRLFMRESAKNVVQKLGMEEGVPIEARMVSRSIERAQTQVEARNFKIRMHLLEYDEVLNSQRKEIYQLRNEVLEGDGGLKYVAAASAELLDGSLETNCPEDADLRDWDLEQLRMDMLAWFNLRVAESEVGPKGIGRQELRTALWDLVATKYDEQVALNGSRNQMRLLEREVILGAVDASWQDHLLAMDQLKEGIGLRGYGRRDPRREYERESLESFGEMRSRIVETVVKTLFRIEPLPESELKRLLELSPGRGP